MVRNDTYEVDNPGEPAPRTYALAKERKQVLVQEGYRVKIRKDSDGVYVVYKKHDQLLHGSSWRDKHG